MEISLTEFLYQLGIVVVVFALCINVFFSKVLEVIRDRESKTTLLEKDAEKRLEKANQISESYRAKIDLAHRETQKVVKAKKEEITSKEDEKFKAEESKMNSEVETERKKILDKFKTKEAEVLKEADGLASDLINRIVQ